MIGILLAGMLEEMGHDVCAIAGTEADAVTAALNHRPDLMIVDARLGEGSGIIAVDQILCSGFVPHLFISGNISKVKAMKPHAVMLEKPFREIDLTRGIQRALDAVSFS